MSPSAVKVVLAWGLGALFVSSPVAGQAAPPASSQPAPPVTTPERPGSAGPEGQVSPTAVLAAPAPAAGAPAAAAPAAPAINVASARGSLERGMTELGTLLMRARQSGNMTRIACVQDKQDRAESVLEVATGEILVLQDPSADAQTRAFAGEKLVEATERLAGLVGQARACEGGDAETRSVSENASTTTQSVMPTDPTSNVPTAPRLPPRIDPRPPVASPVF